MVGVFDMDCSTTIVAYSMTRNGAIVQRSLAKWGLICLGEELLTFVSQLLVDLCDEI